MVKVAFVSEAKVPRVRSSSEVLRPSEVRPVASVRAEIVQFPVVSQSDDAGWQSVGEASAQVLRRLRPAPVVEFPVASRARA